MSFTKLRKSCTEKSLSIEEQQNKINDVRKILGPIVDKLPVLFSDASIIRYLRARNWNVKKAAKMLRETFRWRSEFKPEKIRWDDVAYEAETGKIYRANYFDKKGRTVLVMRPGFQNTSALGGQIRHLVYCIENAIMNSNPDQEQMVWMIDFHRWTMGSISVKAARETANVLQNHYPERLGHAILYNPPKVFESFWTMVKPFIEPKTHKKVKFVYSINPESRKIMEELFDMEKLESVFGGRNPAGFDYEKYGQWMREHDQKMANVINSGFGFPILSFESESQRSGSMTPDDNASEDSDSSVGEETFNLDSIQEKPQSLSPDCSDVATGKAAGSVEETETK